MNLADLLSFFTTSTAGYKTSAFLIGSESVTAASREVSLLDTVDPGGMELVPCLHTMGSKFSVPVLDIQRFDISPLCSSDKWESRVFERAPTSQSHKNRMGIPHERSDLVLGLSERAEMLDSGLVI